MSQLKPDAKSVAHAVRVLLEDEYDGIEVHPCHTTSGSPMLRVWFCDAGKAVNLVITNSRR